MLARYSMMMLDSGTSRSLAASRSSGNLPIGQSFRNPPLGFVQQVHDLPLERRVVLIECDQHLWQNDDSGWK